MSIWRSRVNGLLAATFVGTFTLGAGLILWHAVANANPIADAMMPLVQRY